MGRAELCGGGGGGRIAAHSSQDVMLNEKGSMGTSETTCPGGDSCCSTEPECDGGWRTALSVIKRSTWATKKLVLYSDSGPWN